MENFSGPHLKKCPKCGGKLDRLVGAPAIRRKVKKPREARQSPLKLSMARTRKIRVALKKPRRQGLGRKRNNCAASRMITASSLSDRFEKRDPGPYSPGRFRPWPSE